MALLRHHAIKVVHCELELFKSKKNKMLKIAVVKLMYFLLN